MLYTEEGSSHGEEGVGARLGTSLGHPVCLAPYLHPLHPGTAGFP